MIGMLYCKMMNIAPIDISVSNERKFFIMRLTICGGTFGFLRCKSLTLVSFKLYIMNYKEP